MNQLERASGANHLNVRGIMDALGFREFKFEGIDLETNPVTLKLLGEGDDVMHLVINGAEKSITVGTVVFGNISAVEISGEGVVFEHRTPEGIRTVGIKRSFYSGESIFELRLGKREEISPATPV